MLPVVAFLYIAATYSVLFLDKRMVIHLGEEDGVFEWFDFIFCMGSAFLFFILFFKTNTVQKKSKYAFLILGLLFLFGAGEEISWGQRIFGWGTPDFFKHNNLQGELTIHNLAILQKRTANRLFLLFSICYCFFVPMLASFFHSFNKWMDAYNIPVPSVFIGLFFPVNYGVSKILETFETGRLRGLHYPLIEIKEHNFLFLWVLISLFFLIQTTKQRK